jgi:hypothetical protein
MSRTSVKGSTRRTKSGKRVKVRPYTRHTKPARAKRNAKRGYRSLKRRQYGKAAMLGAAATAEIGAWAFGRGTGVLLTSIGIALVGLGVSARRTAK